MKSTALKGHPDHKDMHTISVIKPVEWHSTQYQYFLWNKQKKTIMNFACLLFISKHAIVFLLLINEVKMELNWHWPWANWLMRHRVSPHLTFLVLNLLILSTFLNPCLFSQFSSLTEVKQNWKVVTLVSHVPKASSCPPGLMTETIFAIKLWNDFL